LVNGRDAFRIIPGSRAPVLTIFQVSDIHFVADADLDLDVELQNAVLRLATRVREDFGAIDAIVVCGDVAYSGLKREYSRAAGFLREVEAGLGATRTFVIPGNHDVYLVDTRGADQDVIRGLPRKLTSSAGERDEALGRLLADPQNSKELLLPLNEYLDFASQYRCDFTARKPFWTSDLLVIDERYAARLRGLNSVLLSNERDKEQQLLLGLLQTTSLTQEPGVVNVTLCHHSYDWLLDGVERRKSLDRRSHLHITGHDHNQAFRETAAGVHLMAGALQPSRRHPEWEPCINVIRLEVVGDQASPELEIEIHEATWDRDVDDFAFGASPRSYRPALEPGSVRSGPGALDDELLRLRRRLALLSSGDRFRAARACGLDLASIAAAPAFEAPGAIIDQARDRDVLGRLWIGVESLHGNQHSQHENPFPIS
jgi:hypothetical protein